MVGNRFTSNMDVIANREYRTFQIANALRENGIDTTILLLNYKTHEHFMADDEKTFSVSVKMTSVFRKLKQIHSNLKNSPPTHIWITNGPIIGLLAWILLPETRKRKIIYEVLDNYDTYYPWYLFPLRWFDKYLRKISFLNLYVSQELEKQDNCNEEKKLLFPNGYNPLIFRPMNMSDCRKELGLPENKILIGYTGTINDRVEENLRKLTRIPCRRNTSFVFASNSPMPQWIKSEKRIIWLGPRKIEQIPVVINACNIMIIPNRKDRFTEFCFPSKLMEYIGCRKPLMTTPVNSFNGLLKHEFISSFNMETFYSDIEKLLDSDFAVIPPEQLIWENLTKTLVSHF